MHVVPAPAHERDGLFGVASSRESRPMIGMSVSPPAEVEAPLSTPDVRRPDTKP
ncbi:hypothetical protein [Amycolatopsis panacis]|uniref:hypothetical protein n=1 Tax=Amycolatopsis panacis TaxID=2340917 RepID=UPI0013143263|nr:hypothetical protein [Amycolatopsis panacis]